MSADATPVRLEPLLNVEAVAAMLDVDRSTVWRWIRTGKLAVVRLGGRTLIDPADLRAYIDANRSKAAAP